MNPIFTDNSRPTIAWLLSLGAEQVAIDYEGGFGQAFGFFGECGDCRLMVEVPDREGRVESEVWSCSFDEECLDRFPWDIWTKCQIARLLLVVEYLDENGAPL